MSVCVECPIGWGSKNRKHGPCGGLNGGFTKSVFGFDGSCNKEYSILGSTLRASRLWKAPSIFRRVENQVEKKQGNAIDTAFT